ncbi:MAG TPA: hypothetical protein ENK10_01660, partial [Acidobacteria bacterium]|nr:hypothetical protein [Acidobacteriota bacterium]
MKKRRPTPDEIADLINLPGPAASTAGADQGPRTIEVTQIELFELNPRLGRNPKYEEIEASIRKSGIEQPIVVTQRPDQVAEDRFTVWGGGNTRVEIAQRLLAETGDDKYRYVTAWVRPWTNAGDALAAHLKENDLRGNLTLVERALAVDRLRRLIEEERGETLSQRELAKALAEKGYRVVRERLGLYRYVVDTLYPAIPEALKAGLGIPQAETLRRLDRVFRQAWRLLEVDGGDDTAAAEIFRARLERLDPDIDPDILRRDLEAELWTAVDDWPAGVLSMLIGYLLEGRDEAEIRAWIEERENEPDPFGDDDQASEPTGQETETGPVTSPVAPSPATTEETTEPPAAGPASAGA